MLCVACLIVVLEILVGRTLTEVWDILVQAVAMPLVRTAEASKIKKPYASIFRDNRAPSDTSRAGQKAGIEIWRIENLNPDEIPCISAVVVTLLAEPKTQIDYTLKAVGGSLTAIHGLSDMIDDTVNSIITYMLQWPHRIVVPIGGIPVDTSEL